MYVWNFVIELCTPPPDRGLSYHKRICAGGRALRTAFLLARQVPTYLPACLPACLPSCLVRWKGEEGVGASARTHAAALQVH